MLFRYYGCLVALLNKASDPHSNQEDQVSRQGKTEDVEDHHKTLSTLASERTPPSHSLLISPPALISD